MKYFRAKKIMKFCITRCDATALFSGKHGCDPAFYRSRGILALSEFRYAHDTTCLTSG